MDDADHKIPMDKWRDYMMQKINHVDAPVANEDWMILKPPQTLLEVKPQSYYPKSVMIGPLYKYLETSLISNYKALCVNKFMERRGISAVEDLIQNLTFDQPHELRRIYNLNLLQSEIQWLQLLVTVDTVFIHEYLLFDGYFDTIYSNDHTLQVRIDRDLLLIGNQIPMSFLNRISYNQEESVRAFIVRCNPFFSSEVLKTRFLGFLANIKLVDTQGAST